MIKIVGLHNGEGEYYSVIIVATNRFGLYIIVATFAIKL
jgi:hypothetical protein